MVGPEVLRQLHSVLCRETCEGVTVTPRHAVPQTPVRNSAVRGVQSIGYNLDAAERVDELLDHALLSQIVTLKASAKSHSLCVENSAGTAQIVTMESQDKNGGPNHLKAWREYRDLTQSELAAKVGTNSNMIGYLESGERGLSAKWLRKLADALDTSPGMILDHDPSTLDSDILEIWATASNRVKRQISEIAKTLLRDGTTG